MSLQLIQDGEGRNAGVFVPINEWNAITQKYQDLKMLVNIEPLPKTKLSELAGKLSNKTSELMQIQILKSREEWEDRLNKS